MPSKQKNPERKRAEEKVRKQNNFLHNVIESIPYPFYVVDARDYSIVLANSLLCPDSAWKGSTCYRLTHHKDAPCEGKEHRCPLEEVVRTGKPVILEHVHFDKEGNERTVEVHGYPVFDENGNVAQMIEYSIDVSEQKRMEARLFRMSISDELTGLLNRRGFMTMAEKQLKITDRAHGSLFLLFADLDDLKTINDHLGHKTGDQALAETGAVLRETFRQSDIIGRLGGDEFAVMLTGEPGIDSERSIVQRLEESLKARNQRKGRPYKLSLSVGVARYDSRHASTLDELMSQADNRMYECKKGKKRFSADRPA